jgi:hypothetical protein
VSPLGWSSARFEEFLTPDRQSAEAVEKCRSESLKPSSTRSETQSGRGAVARRQHAARAAQQVVPLGVARLRQHGGVVRADRDEGGHRVASLRGWTVYPFSANWIARITVFQYTSFQSSLTSLGMRLSLQKVSRTAWSASSISGAAAVSRAAAWRVSQSGPLGPK